MLTILKNIFAVIGALAVCFLFAWGLGQLLYNFLEKDDERRL